MNIGNLSWIPGTTTTSSIGSGQTVTGRELSNGTEMLVNTTSGNGDSLAYNNVMGLSQYINQANNYTLFDNHSGQGFFVGGLQQNGEEVGVTKGGEVFVDSSGSGITEVGTGQAAINSLVQSGAITQQAADALTQLLKGGISNVQDAQKDFGSTMPGGLRPGEATVGYTVHDPKNHGHEYTVGQLANGDYTLHDGAQNGAQILDFGTNPTYSSVKQALQNSGHNPALAGSIMRQISLGNENGPNSVEPSVVDFGSADGSGSGSVSGAATSS